MVVFEFTETKFVMIVMITYSLWNLKAKTQNTVSKESNKNNNIIYLEF